MKTILFLTLLSLLGVQTKNIDADLFAKFLLERGFNEDRRIKASNDETSPSAASALVFMKNTFSDDLCGVPAQKYLEMILQGKSKEEALSEASKLYINAHNRGARQEEDSACQAADIAWREAFVAGRDPIFESAKAFINNWPGLEDGNPCAVSGRDYVNAVINGKTHLEANRIAMASYVDAFKDMARSGRSLKDEACKEATKAFIAAIPDGQKPDLPRARAFRSFMEKIFSDDAPAYDPVCLKGLEGYMESYIAGDDLLTRNLKAARAFFDEFQRGSAVPADSACAAASLAYANEILDTPSKPNAAGMIAYIAEAIENGNRKVDPACAAATTAYWDAFIKNKDEAMANEAAGIAYLDALERYPQTDETSACAKSTQAYIDAFDIELKRRK